jgi:hypothetical protein
MDAILTITALSTLISFHDDAHGAFMTLPPYTRTRKGETRQLGEWSELPPGGPLRYEMLSAFSPFLWVISLNEHASALVVYMPGGKE